MLHTIVPMEDVMRGFGEETEKTRPSQVVDVGGIKMQVDVAGPRHGTIVRLLSTDPAHYMRPECQPGCVVTW